MTPDFNILKWYSSVNEQEYRKAYAFGTVPIIPIDMNQVPPFQLIRSRTGATITRFELVAFKTGTVTDVLSEMSTNGLQVLQPTDKTYDIIYYPATVRISTPLFDRGGYYAVMGDGVNIWYSEVFTMTPYLGDHIKLEWCHGRDFEFSGGHIQYTSSGFGNGYKNYLYIDSYVVKPQYPVTREVKDRDGITQVIRWVRKKTYRFEYIGPESMIDTLSLVEGHDMITLTDQNGNTLTAIEFEMSEPEWFSQGNMAAVTFTIVTEKVVVANYADVSTGTCEVAAGTCIPATGSFYVAKSHIAINGAEWVGGYYYDENSNQTDLESGDYVTAGPDGNRKLYTYNAPDDFTVVSLSGFYTKIYYENSGEYWFDYGSGLNIQESAITGITNLTDPDTFYGRTGNGDGAFYELWLEDAGGGQTFVRRTDNSTLNLGEQITHDGYTYLVLKTVTVKCGVIMEYRYEISTDYLLFTMDDDDFSFVLTITDDNTDYLLGDQDLPSIPVPS